jgi:hypothetical protein
MRATALPASRAPSLLAAAVAFAVPTVLFYRLVMYHFYIRGGFVQDTGLLAALTWHNGITLQMPLAAGGGTFFAVHTAPVLVLLSAISDLLPASMPQMFAGFVGACHGLLALPMFWLLTAGYGTRRGWPLLLACFGAVGFASSGLAIAIARFPHFEPFGAACLLLSLVALVLQHRRIAMLAFALALATREDVGLHAFGFLSLWAIADRLRGVAWRRNAWVIGFALAGLAYSLLALLVQHLAFPGHSSFTRIYLGDPPYAHLTAALLASRLLGWPMAHGYIFIPAIAVLIWAVRTRDAFLLVGYVACVPWTLLHLLAVGPVAGWMVAYYGYPFLIAMAWPFVAGVAGRRTGPASPAPPWKPGAALLALVALSWLPAGPPYDPGRIALPDAFLVQPSAVQQSATDDAITTLAAARNELGPFMVDNSVAAIVPSEFANDELLPWAKATPHTALFLAEGYDADKLRGLPGLPGRYKVPGTTLRIATDRPESVLRLLGIPLEAAK